MRAAAVSFVTAPLRSRSGGKDSRVRDPESTISERELLYDTLRDLDCDFETGKIAEPDYRQTRAELLDQAAASGTGAPEAGTRVEILLPSPVNVHSHAFQRAMAGLTERRGPNPNDSFWTWRQLMFRFLDRAMALVAALRERGEIDVLTMGEVRP